MIVLLDTSRPPRVLEESGKGYWFEDRETMEQEIRDNQYLENGEHNGNIYGTHLDSIRNVIKEGWLFENKKHGKRFPNNYFTLKVKCVSLIVHHLL